MFCEPTDVIYKVTGTTVCGSHLHSLPQGDYALLKGEILGHESMGVVDEVGIEVKKFKEGYRVVASFQIAYVPLAPNSVRFLVFASHITNALVSSCGECSFCSEGLSSMCDRTNTSRLQEKLYGKSFAGLFGYSRFRWGL